MTDFWDVISAFSIPMKIAWAIWIGWGVLQVVSYRSARAAAASTPTMSRARLSPAPSSRPTAPRVLSIVSHDPTPSEMPAEIVESEATGTSGDTSDAETARHGRRRRRSPATAVPA